MRKHFLVFHLSFPANIPPNLPSHTLIQILFKRATHQKQDCGSIYENREICFQIKSFWKVRYIWRALEWAQSTIFTGTHSGHVPASIYNGSWRPSPLAQPECTLATCTHCWCGFSWDHKQFIYWQGKEKMDSQSQCWSGQTVSSALEVQGRPEKGSQVIFFKGLLASSSGVPVTSQEFLWVSHEIRMVKSDDPEG